MYAITSGARRSRSAEFQSLEGYPDIIPHVSQTQKCATHGGVLFVLAPCNLLAVPALGQIQLAKVKAPDSAIMVPLLEIHLTVLEKSDHRGILTSHLGSEQLAPGSCCFQDKYLTGKLFPLSMSAFVSRAYRIPV